MRVLVCGGRDYYHYNTIFNVLADELGGDSGMISEMCHGGAKGADQYAGNVAETLHIPCKVYAAEWSKYGKAAGPIRNRFMLQDFRPDTVVVFPGGKGTHDMMLLAKKSLFVKRIKIVNEFGEVDAHESPFTHFPYHIEELP